MEEGLEILVMGDGNTEFNEEKNSKRNEVIHVGSISKHWVCKRQKM